MAKLISALSEYLWLQIHGGVLTSGWKDLNHQVRWPFHSAVTQRMIEFISALSQNVWLSNLVRCWLRVQGPHQLSCGPIKTSSWCNITSNNLLRSAMFLNIDTISCKRNKVFLQRWRNLQPTWGDNFLLVPAVSL